MSTSPCTVTSPGILPFVKLPLISHFAGFVNLAVKYALLFTVLNASDATQLQIAVVISWVVACIFAYITNRIFVFKSKTKGSKSVKIKLVVK